MFDLKLEKIFYDYALDNTVSFRKLTNNSSSFQLLVEQILSSVTSSAKIREMIVAKYMGFKHNSGVTGHDAEDKYGRSWEIKTEQRDLIDSGVFLGDFRLIGASKWHKSSFNNLQTYLDQEVLQAGFVNGKLTYIVSFSFLETGIYDILSKQKSNRTSVCYIFTKWNKLKSLQLYYLNDRFLDEKYMVSGLIDVLEDLGENIWI
jgi:hypothetical protein